MTREELEHLIRAASVISDDYEIIVVGSQSILGAIPFPVDDLTASMEADVYPMHATEKSDAIDREIGEGSRFHDTHGIYAQGVGPETAHLSPGWETRLIRVQNANTDHRVGWCLDPHDLAASKLAAGREKDWPFVAAMLQHKYVSVALLCERIAALPDRGAITDARRAVLIEWIRTRPFPRPAPADDESEPTTEEPAP